MDQGTLQDAAIRGDMVLLRHILTRDPYALDKIQVGGLVHTPLHMAAFRGHIPLVTEILRRCPSLALTLDHRRWSPLHLAVLGKHLEIVRALLLAGHEMCGVVDGDGNNPLHLAAIMGWNVGLIEMIHVRRYAALAMTTNGESILHLCVKHNQPDCLQLLFTTFSDPSFINAVDIIGNNILHQAVGLKHIQMIRCIIGQNKKVDINATNGIGLTALDILSQQNHHMNAEDLEIRDMLKQVGAKRNTMFGKDNWLTKRRDSLMVVASLIATMAFAAGLNPPGGVWQETSNGHRAGEAIVAYNYIDSYKWYLRSNTIAFVSSLSIILILISGLPLKKPKYMWALQVILWLTITMVAVSYSYALVAVTPIKDRASLKKTLMWAIMGWCFVMALVLLGNVMRLSMKWAEEKSKGYWEKRHRNRNLRRLGQTRSINMV